MYVYMYESVKICDYMEQHGTKFIRECVYVSMCVYVCHGQEDQ
jgi:hypothetical protein